MIVAVVDDLLFGSKIRAAADAGGCTVRFARRGDDVADIVRTSDTSLVIVDLASPGAADAIRVARAAASSPLTIVAFASHVRADLIAEARAAGADRVLARSAFVTELPALVGPSASSSRP
jgi:DNA-binding NarL/FixJ family response regulator